jgi:cytosine/adenosine deaminase-related metal-dependent hydrolase
MKNYTLAHECSEYDLKWGDGIDIEHKRAVKNDLAFITHIEEGYDGEAEEGIDVLMKYKALSEHSVLVHAIALSDKDIKLVSKNKANLVWCPNSNIFMFNRTGNVKKWLQNKINISLGTDSPMSGGMNILDELSFAKKTFKKDNKSEIDDKILTEMVTCNPAKAFRLGKQLGSIEQNKIADLLVINGDTKSPYHALVNASLEDISLVFYGGKPLYGDKEYKDIFKKLGTKTTKLKIGKKEKLCVGNPMGLMKEIRKLVGFKKSLPFLPID